MSRLVLIRVDDDEADELFYEAWAPRHVKGESPEEHVVFISQHDQLMQHLARAIEACSMMAYDCDAELEFVAAGDYREAAKYLRAAAGLDEA